MTTQTAIEEAAMTDFTSKELLERIDRCLRKNSVRMAKKYGI
jgi:hypothetical protein